jgi:hypothetical protein
MVDQYSKIFPEAGPGWGLFIQQNLPKTGGNSVKVIYPKTTGIYSSCVPEYKYSKR